MDKLVDSINNQFRLYFFLPHLNDNILTFLDNNNVNINYYCIFISQIENITHIITSETSKNLISRKLITIENNKNNLEDSYISNLGSDLCINFENLKIKTKDVKNTWITKKASCDDDEHNVKSISNITNIQTFYPHISHSNYQYIPMLL
jgi:hypothetical protein